MADDEGRCCLNVFRNYKPVKKQVENNIIRDAHPNNGQYPWIPNRPVFSLIQPQERGTFFRQLNRSGVGSVGNEGGQ